MQLYSAGHTQHLHYKGLLLMLFGKVTFIYTENHLKHTNTVWSYFFLWLYSPLVLGRFFSFLIVYAVGRTAWTGDQPVAKTLPTPRTTQTQNKHTDIHALSGIETHHPNVRTGEDGSCLRPRGHCDWRLKL
jgi:hypothetical protein